MRCSLPGAAVAANLAVDPAGRDAGAPGESGFGARRERGERGVQERILPRLAMEFTFYFDSRPTLAEATLAR
jgi:hypothetical protein